MVLLLSTGSVLGCVTCKLKNPPPCPRISEDAVGDLEVVIMSGDYESLEIWISEIERYCSAIDSI